MDADLRSFLLAFARIAEAAKAERPDAGELLGDRLRDFLGADPGSCPVVTESVAPIRWADADIAWEAIVADDPAAELIGVRGGEMRLHVSLADMVSPVFGGTRFEVGPVDYATVSVGPDEDRACVSLGLRLFRVDGVPVVLAHRGPNSARGEETAALEVLCADRSVAERLLDRFRGALDAHSVLRGKVISLIQTPFSHGSHGVSYLPRPEVAAEDVVLPPGVLESVVDHVVGIGEHRDRLREQGQHLKRGVLLHGPPGTGKTHTVRHLIGRSPDSTVITLTGRTLGLLKPAADIAVTHQPALVVLEDCDLIAQDRSAGDIQPLLFELLDTMDGLAPDADIAFVLTTNRADVLERALAQRPGRVDLAVEIPLPDQQARARLLRLYGAGLGFGDDALDRVAADTEGSAAAFARELVRRAVVAAAVEGTAPTDDHLLAAAEVLTRQGEELNRAMLGMTSAASTDEASAGQVDDGPAGPEAAVSP